MNRLRETLSQYWLNIQGSLFPWLKEELGELTDKQHQLVMTLEVMRVEEFLLTLHGLPGRPEADRAAIARAFIAKAVYTMPTTRALIERLHCDQPLRRLCGWERDNEIPCESTFSRAFAGFAATSLAIRLHKALIKTSYAGELVGHISRDSTAIEAREKPVKKARKGAQEKAPRKRGRPRGGEPPGQADRRDEFSADA